MTREAPRGAGNAAGAWVARVPGVPGVVRGLAWVPRVGGGAWGWRGCLGLAGVPRVGEDAWGWCGCRGLARVPRVGGGA